MKIIRHNSEEDLIMDLYLPELISGKTPYIGENGHWWIGEIDLGVNAEGLSQEQEWRLEEKIAKNKDLYGQLIVIDEEGDMAAAGNFEEFKSAFERIVNNI